MGVRPSCTPATLLAQRPEPRTTMRLVMNAGRRVRFNTGIQIAATMALTGIEPWFIAMRRGASPCESGYDAYCYRHLAGTFFKSGTLSAGSIFRVFTPMLHHAGSVDCGAQKHTTSAPVRR